MALNIYPDGMTCMAGNCSFSGELAGRNAACVTIEEPSVSVFEIGFDGCLGKDVRRGKEISSAYKMCQVPTALCVQDMCGERLAGYREI